MLSHNFCFPIAKVVEKAAAYLSLKTIFAPAAVRAVVLLAITIYLMLS